MVPPPGAGRVARGPRGPGGGGVDRPGAGERWPGQEWRGGAGPAGGGRAEPMARWDADTELSWREPRRQLADLEQHVRDHPYVGWCGGCQAIRRGANAAQACASPAARCSCGRAWRVEPRSTNCRHFSTCEEWRAGPPECRRRNRRPTSARESLAGRPESPDRGGPLCILDQNPAPRTRSRSTSTASTTSPRQSCPTTASPGAPCACSPRPAAMDAQPFLLETRVLE